MKLNPFENSRTFFTRNSQQTVIRDTFVNQSNPPQEEIKEEIEPEIEVKMSGEPTLDVIQEKPKTSKIKKSTTPQDITDEEA